MAARRIKPTLIDRIQDRYGKTIYRHDERDCDGCDAEKWDGQAEPEARRQPRAGARPADRLPDHLDAGGRGPARHRASRSRPSASRSPARPAPPTTPRTPGSSASRPTSWSASIIGFDTAAVARQRARPAASTRRRSSATSCRWRSKDKPRDAVPRAGRHQADPRQRARPACAPAGEGGGTILEAFKPGTGAAGQLRRSTAAASRQAATALAGGAPRPSAPGTGGLY